MEETMPSLIIIAQPKAIHRERYMCETDRRRNRAQRFVRAEDNEHQLVYPTIGIPPEWIIRHQQPLYIRLTLVTVPSQQAPVRCVHPYPIDTEDIHVIKDPSTNSLYFPISSEELIMGRKTFQFTQKKLTKYQLKAYGQLRILNSDEKDENRLADCSDIRTLIQIYELKKSQLLFSLAVFQNSIQLPVIYDISSVYSQTMTALTTNLIDDDVTFRCTPQKGDCRGGDEILMVIPKLDKRKQFSVQFLHSLTGQCIIVHPEFIDTKTILFYTPPCPVTLTPINPTVTMIIIVIQNNLEIARVNFLYQSLHECLHCGSSLISTNSSASDSAHYGNKRLCPGISQAHASKSTESTSNSRRRKNASRCPRQNLYLTTKPSTSIILDSPFLSSDEYMQENKPKQALRLLEQNNDLIIKKDHKNISEPLFQVSDKKGLVKVKRSRKCKQNNDIYRKANPVLCLAATGSEDTVQDKIKNLAEILYKEATEYQSFRTAQNNYLCAQN